MRALRPLSQPHAHHHPVRDIQPYTHSLQHAYLDPQLHSDGRADAHPKSHGHPGATLPDSYEPALAYSDRISFSDPLAPAHGD